jgi:methionyl aminopeptidase
MTIRIKNQQQIEKMRVAGKLAAEVLEMIAPHVKVGVTTNELDKICADYTANVQQAISAPLNYHGFPKSICTSINHVVCHGIPDDRPLANGDIVNIDITVIKDGFHGDTSKMFLIGDVSEENRRLCELTQQSLYLAIEKVRPGIRFSQIGTCIEKFIKDNSKYTIVREYCGHGIGQDFHEDPQIVHYKPRIPMNPKKRDAADPVMKEGMCFTIEPMINLGVAKTVLDKNDGWTVYTGDNKNSAQYEHTLLVTKDGCEVLTLRQDDTIDREFRHSN